MLILTVTYGKFGNLNCLEESIKLTGHDNSIKTFEGSRLLVIGCLFSTNGQISSNHFSEISKNTIIENEQIFPFPEVKSVDIFNSLDQYTKQIKDHIAASAAAVCVMKDNEIIHEWYSGNHHFHNGARKVDR
ncbi:hypothetical protein [Paenibacillus guangzhouensis]|uniref:hypothetical protein n=1 Tax=Paenibacillus guangzhouensis TaxID=1473112 RepID=UPI00187B5F61|nr:hypothetical protein [Paenibacillus guangzhouensis]